MNAATLVRPAAIALAIVIIPVRAPSWVTQGYPWSNGAVVMELQLGSNSGTLIDGTTSWGQSAENALASWNRYLQNIEFRVNRNSSASIAGGNGRSNVFFSSTVYGRSFNSYASPTQGGGIVAVSLSWWSNSRRTESDVVFNSNLPWNSYRGNYRRLSSGALLNEFYRTALHEFGHTLGLQHPNDYSQSVSAIMNSNLSNNYTLTSDDIAGVQSLYGTVTVSAPGAPSGLTATASSSSVSLAWNAPTSGGAPSAYTIEGGSSSGLANLVNFSTGSTATTYSASGVAAGAYYVRVRATNSAGKSAASNEALLTVGGGGCSAAPGAPGGLRLVSSSGGTVMLAWSGATGTPTAYIVEAGSGPGLTNLANTDLGGTTTSFTAPNVPRGTYYVRIRGKNACGIGGASNELILVV